MNKIFTLLSVTALALTACTREEMPEQAVVESIEDLVTFEVGFAIPTDDTPATKVMADAATINNIYVAVFGSNNYLNEFVKAIPLTSAGGDISLEGGEYKYVKNGGVYNVRFSLKPTTSKRYVHVLANVPEGSTPPDFGYVDEVLGKNLYTSDNQDGYWQYLEFNDGIDGTATTTNRFNGLKLVRNFAKVVLDPGSNFDLVGFELYDTPTRGSFAAYEGKVVGGGSVTYNFFSDWGTTDPAAYTTVLGTYSGYLMPGATPLYRPTSSTWDNTDGKFTYEHPASEDNPTFIVAKLTKKPSGPTKYYRLDILDNEGRKSPLLRNYIYTVTIDDISSGGSDTPEEAIETPSDYNFTLSEQSHDAYEIENNGAYMEIEYVEKVFTKAASDVPFKYRYTADISASPRVYSPGMVSAVSGDGEVTADWVADAAGSGPAEGWYTVTYDVADPSGIGSDQMVSSFYVNAGEGKKMIQRRVDIISMKKKQLTVTNWALSGTSLNLTFTVPEGLRPSMFPIQFKFEAYDISTSEQTLSPQTEGLISSYELTSSGSIIYFLKDYFYSDYTTSKTISIDFESPSAVKPQVLLTDLNDYFEPLDLGAGFVTGLAAPSIAKGAGHSTTMKFRAATSNPMTITLTKLTATEFDDATGTLAKTGESGDTYTYTFNPKVTGNKQIVLTATTNDAEGRVEMALVTPDPTNYPPSSYPDPLTVARYDKYVKGSLNQAAELPLGTGQTTTFSFEYSARDLMDVTITAPGVNLSLAGTTDGTLTGSDGNYTYTPGSTGVKTFTITSKTNFEDAGTISLSMPYMSNPSPLSVKRATKIVIDTGNLILDDATDFSAPMYWRTKKTYSTSGTAGSSDYFTANGAGDGSNTGKISIDISSFNKADSTPVYFLYTYTQRILIFIPITRYKFASLTLSQLLSAAAGTPQTLTFTD